MDTLGSDSDYIPFFDNALQDVDLNVAYVTKHYTELETWLGASSWVTDSSVTECWLRLTRERHEEIN